MLIHSSQLQGINWQLCPDLQHFPQSQQSSLSPVLLMRSCRFFRYLFLFYSLPNLSHFFSYSSWSLYLLSNFLPFILTFPLGVIESPNDLAFFFSPFFFSLFLFQLFFLLSQPRPLDPIYPFKFSHIAEVCEEDKKNILLRLLSTYI